MKVVWKPPLPWWAIFVAVACIALIVAAAGHHTLARAALAIGAVSLLAAGLSWLYDNRPQERPVCPHCGNRSDDLRRYPVCRKCGRETGLMKAD